MILKKLNAYKKSKIMIKKSGILVAALVLMVVTKL